VDCGAYDGDTLRDLAATGLPFEAVAAFEPDPANFAKLAQSLAGKSATSTICLYPCGVSARTTQIRFSTGGGESSRFSDDGEVVIPCVALDEALVHFRPNLIKMDIEGAEYDALLGARQLIERDRPGLAICVYHRPEDLWRIPLLMAGWLQGGRHYLRLHAHHTFDLVYYWVPDGPEK
jgi:FkbM family methyltransferase